MVRTLLIWKRNFNFFYYRFFLKVGSKATILTECRKHVAYLMEVITRINPGSAQKLTFVVVAAFLCSQIFIWLPLQLKMTTAVVFSVSRPCWQVLGRDISALHFTKGNNTEQGHCTSQKNRLVIVCVGMFFCITMMRKFGWCLIQCFYF